MGWGREQLLVPPSLPAAPHMHRQGRAHLHNQPAFPVSPRALRDSRPVSTLEVWAWERQGAQTGWTGLEKVDLLRPPCHPAQEELVNAGDGVARVLGRGRSRGCGEAGQGLQPPTFPERLGSRWHTHCLIRSATCSRVKQVGGTEALGQQSRPAPADGS